MTGIYDYRLVLVSFFVAFMGSYCTLHIIGSISKAKGIKAFFWIFCGSASMGISTWSMHFIGMLAFELPIAVGYDYKLTMLSLFYIVSASAVSFLIVGFQGLSKLRLMLASVVLCFGVTAMHFTGMQAMMMYPDITYTPLLFLASIFIACSASAAALKISTIIRRKEDGRISLRFFGALSMAVAICGMHYTGMAAAEFQDGSICGAKIIGISNSILGLAVGIITSIILSLALIFSFVDAKISFMRRELKLFLVENVELSQQAFRDGLTRVYNRVGLEKKIFQMIDESRERKLIFCLMYIDFDGFKSINDSYGHQAGDLMLKEASIRMSSIVREDDVVARLGGDEFVVAAWVGSVSEAEVIAKKILVALNEPFQYFKNDLIVSGSIGLAMYPSHGESCAELLSAADKAMYAVKKDGKNSFKIYSGQHS